MAGEDHPLNLEEILGIGGSGLVVKARDKTVGKVAVKVVTPQVNGLTFVEKERTRLEREVATMQRARLFADRMQGGAQAATIDRQKEQAERKLAIIAELNPHERRQPKLLDLPARRAIAAKLGVRVEHVHELLFEYQLQRAQWTYLRREYLRGRPLPNSSEELEWQMRRKPTKPVFSERDLVALDE